MCLEPFGATGLFILGRGGLLLLLLLGVGRERGREGRKKRKGGRKRMGNLEECPRSAQRPQVSSQELALPHFIIASRTRPQARQEGERKDTGRQPVHTSQSEGCLTVPKKTRKIKKEKQDKTHTCTRAILSQLFLKLITTLYCLQWGKKK